MTSTAPDIRVVTFDGPGTPPVLRRVPRPSVPPRGALIRIEACGVCGTDLHILQGHWPGALPWPITLGHELAGVVEEIGPQLRTDATGAPLREGDHVMLPPLNACGVCEVCVETPERANKCLNPTYYGRKISYHRPPHLWGGWADMVFVDLDSFPATKLFRLPDDMPLMVGTLVEPYSSVTRAFNRVDALGLQVQTEGASVVIQGAGPIGLLATVAARQRGAGTVVMVGDPETPRLKLARAFGADHTVSLTETPNAADRIASVREAAGGRGADIVIGCSGNPAAGPEGVEMLRDGGTFVEMGQFTDAGSFDTSWHRFCTKEIQLLGSWAFTPDEVAQAMRDLHAIQSDHPWPSLHTRFSLSAEGVTAAISAATRMTCLKATVVPAMADGA